jgi:hypothetical protein
MTDTHGVLYLHGLESGPDGSKAAWLKRTQAAFAVDLDTTHARASATQAKASGVPWDHQWRDIKGDFRVPLERARAAIGPETRVIVGSSFGGAVLTHLIHEGSWRGPSLFIASAGLKLTGHQALPEGARHLLLHGRDDTVVPLSDSRTIAAQSGDNVVLWEVSDGHRMKTIMPSGLLDLAVDWLRT